VRAKLKAIKKQILVFQGLDDRIHTDDVIRSITRRAEQAFCAPEELRAFCTRRKTDKFNEETLAFLTENGGTEPHGTEYDAPSF
jgi:hypothetical protein